MSHDSRSLDDEPLAVERPDDEPRAGGQRRERRKKNARRNTIEWIIVVAGALAIAIVIKTFLFQAFYIPSESMEPTLNIGDRVLVNKLSYRLHDIHHGDIVVFTRPSADGQTIEGCDGQPVVIAPGPRGSRDVNDLIKRVIGLPGDTVEQRDGRIFVNGKAVDDSYVHKTNGATDRTPAFQFSSQCIKVPKDRVFVLGDNRGDSSASNVFGPIPESTIVGRAFVRVWPVSQLGGV